MRKTYSWTLPRTVVALGKRTAIMGILNVTPDSFSDGGLYLNVNAAVDRGHQMQEEGADIVDIGGESSRPGSLPVSEEEEMRRVLPVIEALSGRLTIPISVDTYRSAVARRALDAGAQAVNDISAFRFDPAMSHVIQESGAATILMHSRGSREQLHQQAPMLDPIREIQAGLMQAIRQAAAIGIAQAAIVVDPGIGFGMRAEESVSVLHNLQVLSQLEYPLLIGTSRKSFLRKIAVSGSSGADINDRLWSTAATVAAAVLRGAHIVRVHDVTAMRPFVDALDAL
jgi:dihydropteroate synthase